MLNQSISTGKQMVGIEFPETIQSRFGEISVDPSRGISFPRGILGMPDKLNFVLTNFNSEKMGQFKLLQSLDDFQLSFITLPVDINKSVIAIEDVHKAADELQIEHEDVVVLLIVSVHRSPSNVRISVNARAPLILDSSQKTGVQYVFHDDKYKVQHML
ncbi:MAG: flagellar assembly protein FliW [Rickettsiales bacterium]